MNVMTTTRRTTLALGLGFWVQGRGQDLGLEEATIIDLQSAMTLGRVTSVELVRGYLDRIAKVDRAGPKLNSVLEINPDAQAIAAALDRERKEKGPRGPLHGVPILLKDNIDTGDKMMT